MFRELGVKCVIRFNRRCYDRRRFVEGGIKHVDLYYEDGGNPSEEILQRFLRICEDTRVCEPSLSFLYVCVFVCVVGFSCVHAL